MKSTVMIFCLLMFASFAMAQAPAPSASPAPIASASPAPSASPALAVVPAPAQVPVVVPAGDAVVAAPSAPPQWAQDLISSASTLPVIGPYVAKALLWMGILSAILTALVACILSVLSILKGVLNLTSLNSVAAQIQAFQDGKVMYWLKYLSMFNAQKKTTSA